MIERVHTDLTAVHRRAVYSDCERYRYLLQIQWDTQRGCLQAIGLNPSTATELVDDPTIRRLKRFARDFGFGGLLMTNLFAFRSTDPSALRRAEDPIGPLNTPQFLAEQTMNTVACWGAHKAARLRGEEVRSYFRDHLIKLKAFGFTRDGHPLHPLYLPANTSLVTWEPTPKCHERYPSEPGRWCDAKGPGGFMGHTCQ